MRPHVFDPGEHLRHHGIEDSLKRADVCHFFAIEFRIRSPYGDVREIDMLELDVVVPTRYMAGPERLTLPLTLHTSIGDRNTEWYL